MSSVEPATDIEILEQTCEALQEHQNVLLILDNAEDLDSFSGKSSGGLPLSRFLPSDAHVLLTTRDPRFRGSEFFPPASHGTRLAPLSEDEAFGLLTNSIPAELATAANIQTTKQLLNELGGLPLAIAQVATNLRALQLGLAKYVETYQDPEAYTKLLQEAAIEDWGSELGTKSNSILVTWEVPFEHLEQDFPKSTLLLDIMCLYHWNDIPEQMITHWPGRGELPPVKIQDTIKHLLHFSLVARSTLSDRTSVYNLHPIIHKRVFSRLRSRNTGRLENLASTAVSRTADEFPMLETDPVSARNSNDFTKARSLIAHARYQLALMHKLNLKTMQGVKVLLHVSRYFEATNMTGLAVEMSSRGGSVASSLKDVEIQRLYMLAAHAGCLCSNAQYEEGKSISLRCAEMLEIPAVVGGILRSSLGTRASA